MIGQTYLTADNRSLTCIELEYGGPAGHMEPTTVILFDGSKRFRRSVKEMQDALNNKKIQMFTFPWKK